MTTKSSLTAALLCTALLLAAYHPASAQSGPTPTLPSPSYPTVGEILSSSPLFSKALKTVIQATGLNDVFYQPEFIGTVFAPTDAALNVFLRKTGLSVLGIVSKPKLYLPLWDSLLRLHVTYSVIPSSKVPLSPKTLSINTPANEKLTATKTAKGKVIISSYGSTATVIKANLKAPKAYVHIINQVLIPDTIFPNFPGCQTIVQFLTKLKLTNLLALLKKGGLYEGFTEKAARVVLLAPTDKAIKSFLAKQKTTLDKLTKQQVLNLLYYHVISTYPAPAKAIKNGQVISTQLENMGTKYTLKATVNSSGLSFKGAKSTAKVVPNGADYFACFAVIHVVDTVLIPPTL